MASKLYQDGVAPASTGIRYQLTEQTDGTSTIENVTSWTQAPSELRAADILSGMVLECDHTYANGNHALSNPNPLTALRSIRFTASAPFTTGDTISINGTPVLAQYTSGEELSDGAFIMGAGTTAVLVSTSEGPVLNFKAGGGGLRIRVITAASEEDLPVTAKDGTVALIGEELTLMGQPYFGPTAPSGEALWNGRVWLPNDSKSSLLVANDINLSLPITSPQFYNGAAWSEPEAYIMQAGQWQTFTDYIYHSGAWRTTVERFDDAGAAYAEHGDHFSYTITSGGRGVITTSDAVDLSDYTKIHMDGYSPASFARFGHSSSKPSNAYPTLTEFTNINNYASRQVFTLDVSAVNAPVYLIFTAAADAFVYDWWLE